MGMIHEKAMGVDVRMKEETQEAQEILDEIEEEIANATDDQKVAELQKSKAELQAELDRQRYSE